MRPSKKGGSHRSASPTYIVFAGINGSGKSTLFRTGLWRTPEMPSQMPRVNPDEILKEKGGNWSNLADQFTAGKIALERIDECLTKRRSFNQETTLAGKKTLQTIARAHSLGYRVVLFYVGVDQAETAIRRIEHRTGQGGHGIDASIVRKRYHVSLSNFSKALDLCEEAYVFDNSERFKCIATWKSGVLTWWGVSSSVGLWLFDAMSNKSVWR